MKSFLGINCFCKEQERLMWAFAGCVTSPGRDTSLLKVVKTHLFSRVNNRPNGCSSWGEVGHSKWTRLDEAERTLSLWHAQSFILQVDYLQNQWPLTGLWEIEVSWIWIVPVWSSAACTHHLLPVIGIEVHLISISAANILKIGLCGDVLHVLTPEPRGGVDCFIFNSRPTFHS